MHSEMKLTDWRGDLTMFAGFYNTLTDEAIINETWPVIVANIAPSVGLAVIEQKEFGVYFVPCLLREAEFVGKTLERAMKHGAVTVGRQRSASHVTEAQMIVADLDSIEAEQLGRIEQRMADAGLTYLVYSSHSHGRQDKPGTRCRIIVPVDRPLDSAAYKYAAAKLNELMLDGLSDPAGFALHQQQGTWATAAERVAMAFRREHRAGVCDASVLLQGMQAVSRPALRVINGGAIEVQKLDPAKRLQIEMALAVLDPDSYDEWIGAALRLKASYGNSAYPLWVEWSQQASETHRADENECQRVWDAAIPRISPEQGAGAFFGHARDESLRVGKAAGKSRVWDTRARAAIAYLQGFHRRAFDEHFAVRSRA
ncbi:hypothetical protein MASR1M60_14060 [Rhodocyclaceae bacterium]